MPHSQQCRDEIAAMGLDPGWCNGTGGGCTFTREDNPGLFEAMQAKGRSFTAPFKIPDHRHRPQPEGHPMRFISKPTSIEAIRWTGKNTTDVKAWVHSRFVADGDSAVHPPMALFIKRRGAHMTEVLWGNVIPDSKPEVTAAIWVADYDRYVGIVDGEWITKSRLGFLPVPDEGGAPMGYLDPSKYEPDDEQWAAYAATYGDGGVGQE